MTEGVDGSAPVPFPPATAAAFLELCAGRWLSLRSRFLLSLAEEGWHTSERGDLTIDLLPGPDAGGSIGLQVAVSGRPAVCLWFDADGGLRSGAAGAEAAPVGRWQFWPDASLELRTAAPAGGGERRERIWFTKPNLRLRSTTAFRSDGTPDQASFCSEIRRVGAGAAPGSR
jgi:hypothetical protein